MADKVVLQKFALYSREGGLISTTNDSSFFRQVFQDCHPPDTVANQLLQGEVESIAQMKPKAASEHEDGLLEYLEDIIGTSKYKEPIEQALQGMEELQESRTEKMNRLRIVEREKNALEDQKKDAENYLRIYNEHVRALSRLWQWYLWKCAVNEEELNRKVVRISDVFALKVKLSVCGRTELRKSSQLRGSKIRMTSRTWKCSKSITRNARRHTKSVELKYKSMYALNALMLGRQSCRCRGCERSCYTRETRRRS